MRACTRTRRASFLPRDVSGRGCASMTFDSAGFDFVAVAISLCPSKLYSKANLCKQRADRGLLVDRLDRSRDQARDRKHFDLLLVLARLGQRDGVGHDHFLDA